MSASLQPQPQPAPLKRFLRPPDAARAPRNMRRIRLHRLVALARNAIFVLVFAAGVIWINQRVHSDTRFAVRHIEIDGAVHTPQAALTAATQRYRGANLFDIDIAHVQSDLHALRWVERITIEKKIPDTLRIHVQERIPVALLASERGIEYVDAGGVILDRLSLRVGDADLPVVSGAQGDEIRRCVAFLETLRHSDPQVYADIAEVRPLPPSGFAVFDRDLGMFIDLSGADAGAKWRTLHAIAAAEGFHRGDVAYADLRFADRVIVRPAHPIVPAGEPLPRQQQVEITN